MEVQNIQELEEALKALQPGKEIKIVYKLEGKEIVLEGSAHASK